MRNQKRKIRQASVLGVFAAAICVLASACGGGDSVSEEEAREALPRMVLQETDVPEGLQRAGEDFTTNQQLTEGGLGGAPPAERVEEWGRVLGYETDFQAAELPAGPLITGLDTAVSLYKTPEGATASFEDTAARAREADWATYYDDLREFQQREVERELPVDGAVWLRLSGMRPRVDAQGHVLVVDDQIIYRVGTARGYLRVLTSQDGAIDRDLVLQQVEALLRTQIQNTRDGLQQLG
jgi:hypothetical protein